MGNSLSSINNTENSSTITKHFNNFYEIIDYIASHYILTMDFKSMSKLSEKEFCDNLVVLTSDIIEKNFSELEVEYLAQRIKSGLEVNELTKDKILFLNKDVIDRFNISDDTKRNIKKKRICIGIAKFYVKIAHIFAAIMMTINPVYSYKDETGNTIKVNLMERDKIPKNVKRNIYKLNICDNRIKALKRGEQFVGTTSTTVKLHPKICNLNTTKDGNVKTLEDEPGMKELMQLYLDDKYDYSTGKFMGMSESTEKEFKNDLSSFYKAFTGNKEIPFDVTKFSDIKLRDYDKNVSCQGPNAIFKKTYDISKNDELYINYANNIKNMITSAAQKQNELLSIINELFVFVNDPSGTKKIRVNPRLSEELLQKNLQKTRKIIVELYVKCEEDFVNGVKLYEAIVEKKILETTQKQIDNLQKKADEIIQDTKKIIKESQPPPAVQKPVISNTPNINIKPAASKSNPLNPNPILPIPLKPITPNESLPVKV